MSKKIDKLTPEQEKMIPVYIKRYSDPVFDGTYYKNFDAAKAEKMIEWVYKFCDYKVPPVIVVDNPVQAQLVFNALKNDPKMLKNIDKLKSSVGKMTPDKYLEKEIGKNVMGNLKSIESKYKEVNDQYLFACDVYSNVIIGFYSYLIEVLELDAEIVPLFKEWKALYMDSCIYNGIFADEVCIISKYPHTIKRNEENQLHCLTGPAVEFDGWEGYYINGRHIPTNIYLKALNGDLTRNEFVEEENEEYRAAYFEILGSEKLMEMLGAEIVDETDHTHDNGEVEHLVLYMTKDVVPGIDEKLAWVKFICPSTSTNYMISVEPKWTSALEAAASTSPLIMDADDYKFDYRA